jgi:choline dehydrogenase-like flavoprotein
MRIAIFGTGGAGAYFGARLARAAEDVVFIARGSHLQAIKADGLRVETPAGEIVVRPAQATDDPAGRDPPLRKADRRLHRGFCGGHSGRAARQPARRTCTDAAHGARLRVYYCGTMGRRGTGR